eukprot:CAMPEP_0204130978 /NCGR_PEP_ID=MMETSP0361-20130328/13673_1 /ASSEMBLY_ACC=CAM_ASM_000343 /TAXON_ID=268821 /ORGANISM="Scrippsiella Hangoei, Strain SHTV-5" /LENGTH=44 /DNA_ID= /DNA_START= /DNA_END= /DNA_ORIENTATION=
MPPLNSPPGLTRALTDGPSHGAFWADGRQTASAVGRARLTPETG